LPDRLELSTFEPHVGETFVLEVEGLGKVELTLAEAEASPWQPAPDAGLPPAFSLVFRGPPQVVLPQNTYRMRHDALGDLDIFVTPIAGSDEGVDYQAVFS
jgi:hypothetical protein